jgi:D-3-phosphoglycerate dehydrogenase / 2-oxoglutarate reductase
MRVAIGPSSFAQADDTPLRILEAAGCEVVPNPFSRRLTEPEIIEHLKGIDGLIAGLEPLNRSVIASAPQLKAIARVGIGVTNVDFDAAAEHDVAVSSTPDGPVQAVAELTLTALLTLLREVVPANTALHEGRWEKRIGRGLSGTRVLLVGFGRIGQKFAGFLSSFGSEISYFDPHITENSECSVIRETSLEEALAKADVVSLHASGTEPIIGNAQFDAMQDGAILLNSARGELVDEAALIGALDSGRIGGCWFDAFTEEPYVGPLTNYPQALLTPHVGTYTRQCRLAMESTAVENLLRDLGL